MRVHGRSTKRCNTDSFKVLMAFHELDILVPPRGSAAGAAAGAAMAAGPGAAPAAAAAAAAGGAPSGISSRRIISFIDRQRTDLAHLINMWNANAPNYPRTAEEHTSRWRGDLAAYLFGSTGSAQQRLVWTREVTDQINLLRAINITKLRFTSCRLGTDRSTMIKFRQLFGAQSVKAPDVRSFFIGPHLMPKAGHIGPRPVQRLDSQGQVRTFGPPKAEVKGADGFGGGCSRPGCPRRVWHPPCITGIEMALSPRLIHRQTGPVTC